MLQKTWDAIVKAQPIRERFNSDAKRTAIQAASNAVKLNKFTAEPGRGAERGSIVIEIDWSSWTAAEVEMILLRDTGDTRKLSDFFPANTFGSTLSRRKTSGLFRYVDVQVRRGQVYNYYILFETRAHWKEHYYQSFSSPNGVENDMLSANKSGRSQGITINHFDPVHANVSTISETKKDFLNRKVEEAMAEANLQRNRPKPKPVFDLDKEAARLIERSKSVEEFQEKMEALRDQVPPEMWEEVEAELVASFQQHLEGS